MTTGLEGPGILEVLAQLAVALIGFVALNWRAAGGSSMDEPVHYWFSVAASIALFGLQLFGLQVSNAAGLFPESDFGVYLLGVIWLVIESAHIFWVSFRLSLGNEE